MLNFLKRKRKAQPGILLYYDLLNTTHSNHIDKSCTCKEFQPAKMDSDSAKPSAEVFDTENVESQSRDKANKGIEKLINKIYELMADEESKPQKNHPLTESPLDMKELQSISAMAKKLNTNSKKSNIHTG